MMVSPSFIIIHNIHQNERTSAARQSATQRDMAPDVSDTFFATKKIPGAGTIVLQNTNGPCPLIAIVNACVLRGTLAPRDFLHHEAAVDDSVGTTTTTTTTGSEEDVEDVGGVHVDGLLRAVSNVIMKRQAKDAEDANVQRTCADALEALPSTARGMDVNVKFSTCDGFEYTSAIGIFDACDLVLKHAWVVSAEEHGEATRDVVGRASYNALVERLIDLRTRVEESSRAPPTPTGSVDNAAGVSGSSGKDVVVGGDGDDEYSRERAASSSTVGGHRAADNDDESDKLARAMHELMIIEDFLDSTRGQLTQTGVAEMRDTIRDGAYVIFFRNNHFAVAHKRDEQLYTLVTDQGYLNEPDVVWECLGGARDGEFVTATFTPFQAHVSSAPPPRAPTLTVESSRAALPADFLRTSSDDERRAADSANASPLTEAFASATIDTDADYAAALQLQFDAEDEERRRREAASASERQRVVANLGASRAQSSTTIPPSRTTPSHKNKSKSKSSDCVVQ